MLLHRLTSVTYGYWTGLEFAPGTDLVDCHGEQCDTFLRWKLADGSQDGAKIEGMILVLSFNRGKYV